jgi:hypothetical protein
MYSQYKSRRVLFGGHRARRLVALALLAGTVIALASLDGCETRVIKDNSVDARLSRSMPAGNLQNGRGETYQAQRVNGQSVPPDYIPNSAAPGNWTHGFAPPTGP